MTLYLGYALLGFLCGYALCHSRRPACQREHLPRHLDPAIVNRESDDGIQPPDPRTTTPTYTGNVWPDGLRHENHGFGVWAYDCPRCVADRWRVPHG